MTTKAGLKSTVLSWHTRAGEVGLRGAVFVVARPVMALLNALVVGVVGCLYYVISGLVPVFGIAAPAYLSFHYLWSSGVLPSKAG